jgi:hypothetical protein
MMSGSRPIGDNPPALLLSINKALPFPTRTWNDGMLEYWAVTAKRLNIVAQGQRRSRATLGIRFNTTSAP